MSDLSTQHSNKVVTIDGPAASGKGTIARKLCENLGLAYIDTGAIYRIVAKSCLETAIDITDEGKVAAEAKRLAPSITLDDFKDPTIRTEQVSQTTSKISALPAVRAALLDIQRFFAQQPPLLEGGKTARGTLFDGRDTGTIICPDADIKFFVTANLKIRAQRRHKELQLNGFQCTYETVLQDMMQRDERDSGRDAAPLKPADDAIIIDTSDETIDQIYHKMMGMITERFDKA